MIGRVPVGGRVCISYLSLRQCEIEEEYHLEEPVERNPSVPETSRQSARESVSMGSCPDYAPSHEPLAHVFNGENDAENRPVHEPSFEISLRCRSLREGLVGRVCRIQEGTSQTGQLGISCGLCSGRSGRRNIPCIYYIPQHTRK